MKFAIALLALSLAAISQSQTAPDKLEPSPTGPVDSDGKPRGPFIRNLPADELRDFRGYCFASTLCRVFEVSESWPLTPFCGIAQCIQTQEGFLIERVEDCGPLPKPNPKCSVINDDARNESFPLCCPQFECTDGQKIEYPTLKELHDQAIRLTQPQQDLTGGNHA